MAGLLYTVATQPALAKAATEEVGTSASAMPGIGRVAVAGPLTATSAFAVGTSYGYTEAVLGAGDSHHRVAGSVAASMPLLGWLSAGLRLDGRYDLHYASSGDDAGLVGDPRLLVRASRQVGPVWLGAEATVWLPGDDVPSVLVDAVSPDLRVLGAYSRGPLTIAVDAGYRLDRSGESAPQRDSLSAADRLALAVSDSDAALLGIGVAWRLRTLELLGEWTWNPLVGEQAPSLAQSPMRAAAGVRLAAASGMSCQLLVEANLAERPELGVGSPLVPVEPRVGVLLGASYTPRHRRVSWPRGGEAEVAEREPAPAPPAFATLKGRVLGVDGNPIPGVSVEVQAAGASAAARALAVAEDGTIDAEALPPGVVTVTARAEGHKETVREITLTAGRTSEVALALEPAVLEGELRGTVRSFDGSALVATVSVETLGKSVSTDADGAFRLIVPPGEYDVKVESARHQTQVRHVRITENGVTFLNVDLRKGSP